MLNLVRLPCKEKKKTENAGFSFGIFVHLPYKFCVMKTFYLLAGLFLSINVYAQSMDIEDRDDSFILENNKNIQKIEIQQPFYQIPVKGCKDFTSAGFEGGAKAYSNLLRNNMYTFLNTNYYTLDGTFSFTLTINENGKISNIEGTPKIPNSEIFFDDMKYVIRRISQNWAPAKCGGKAVSSQMKIKMNFSSVTADL
ncbi:MAG: hypothetical protein QM564_04470 [Bergeyella sp.]